MAGAAIAAALTPAVALAQVNSSTQTEIRSIISQIQELQKRLQALIGSGGMFKPIGMEDQGLVSGKISAVASSSITVQSKDGLKSTVVNFTASTTIEVFSTSTSQWLAGTSDDLVVDRAVGVWGSASTDGSVAATKIKVGIVLAIADKMQNLPPGQVGKAMCISLNRTLGPGSHGEDVRKLQEMLAGDSSLGFNTSPSGVWGPITSRAMIHWQKKQGLTPANDGTAGPLTRGILMRRCGEGLVNTRDARYLVGTITAHSGSSITLQARNESKSVMVYINSSTVITIAGATEATTGTTADLTVGKLVEVKGVWENQGEGKSFIASHVRIGLWQPAVTPPPQPASDDDEDEDADEVDDDADNEDDDEEDDEDEEDEDEDDEDDTEDDDDTEDTE